MQIGIIDQQTTGLVQRLRDRIEQVVGNKLDEPRLRSAAFVLLCTKTLLAMEDEEALDALTEGGGDFGVDAMHASDPEDYEFTITLIQCKYHSSLSGAEGFPEEGVIKAIQAVRTFLNPSARLHANARVLAKVEEIRSLIRDGNYPRVRVLLCNNGRSWKLPEAQALIDNEGWNDHVRFEHVNHDTLFGIFSRPQKVDDSIQFSGRWIREDLSYSSVFVGKVSVEELARLMETHGDRLLEGNIRRYLGLRGNRVNEEIRATLVKPEERPNFFFYNNGLTVVCRQFQYNAGQGLDLKVRVKQLQIINGGQTCRTIHQTLNELDDASRVNLDQAYVLVRLYQVGDDGQNVVQRITLATNSQNQVDLRDLRSNDDLQRQLEIGMKELGFVYRRHRTDLVGNPATEISSMTVAEAVLAIWRRRPQELKFNARQLFDKLYPRIFTGDLNATQAILAVKLFRFAENKRKNPPEEDADLIRYGSCFIAMLMGKSLLLDLNIPLKELTHKRFADGVRRIDESGEEYFQRGKTTIKTAVRNLYGGREIGTISLQQLAATFRRGDLMEELVKNGDLPAGSA